MSTDTHYKERVILDRYTKDRRIYKVTKYFKDSATEVNQHVVNYSHPLIEKEIIKKLIEMTEAGLLVWMRVKPNDIYMGGFLGTSYKGVYCKISRGGYNSDKGVDDYCLSIGNVLSLEREHFD